MIPTTTGRPSMGREIKFRAWDPCNNRMYENPVIVFDDMGAEAYENYNEVEDGIRRGSILLQYTGLKDKNGKEIYEGDVLYFDLQDYNGTDHFYKEAVIFFHGSFGCILHYRDGQEGWISLLEIADTDDELEVIGNIYENPELVKG